MTNNGSLGRRGLFRAGGIGLAAVALAPALASCSRTEETVTLESLREQGFIRVAINNEAPFGYIGDDGEVTGSSPELLRAIFSELGVGEVRAESVAWDGLVPGLKAGRYDAVAAGMYVTPERCAEVAFAEPDYRILQAFLVPAGNPDGLATFEDIASNPDVKVAVLNASVEQGYAEGAGVPADQIETVDNQVTAYELLENGRVQAVGLSTISLNRLMEQHGGDFEVTEGFTPVVDGEEVTPAGALAFRPADTELLAEVNRVLAEFKENGQLLQTMEPFGFTEAELPGDLTTEQLCQG
ncbi:ectoine/hydroxyectoine ABC transporter substrate-binding protein EhuB [Actinorugispora endophytica]|uniref:Amino acid ABC transporter substrate-binding protein (PAAT family) n=1 Tax=Actinorugispora endophytica TaxID=1605990 RepID=A0A4R6V4F0_9ACTN|nr:ectoine/hydroxyectoine ABC transporter substrate-binding protein EhuB [Actinorugispora endophytica]TDQ55063.1 amino acid ABC transporter substrate-binding protein (PAAT family) [Actinorugispora endophytica]